jgi:Family of unknown function (DUF6081)
MSLAPPYDDFCGTELDPGRWRYLELPRGVHASWRCEEPGARTEVGEGTLDMHVARFTRSHDKLQIFDNLKHQLLSRQAFTSPAEGRVTYSVEVAATGIGDSLYDYRDGQATFILLDPQTGWSFRTCTTSHHVFAIHEVVQAQRVASPEDIIDCGESRVTVQPGRSHQHGVTLDFSNNSIEWQVDSKSIF